MRDAGGGIRAWRDRPGGRTKRRSARREGRRHPGVSAPLGVKRNAPRARRSAHYFLCGPIGSTTLPYSSFHTWAMDP
jgi:hypothetical protein